MGASAEAYSREDTRRLLGITERRLAGWERQKLVARSASYGFREMLALRTLARLRENKVPPAQIRRALAALIDKLSHVRDPLTVHHVGQGAEVAERGGPHLAAVRSVAAVADDVEAELTAGRLHRLVDLTSRWAVALGGELEMMDQRLHRGVDLVAGRKHHLAVGGVEGAGR